RFFLVKQQEQRLRRRDRLQVRAVPRQRREHLAELRPDRRREVESVDHADAPTSSSRTSVASPSTTSPTPSCAASRTTSASVGGVYPACSSTGPPFAPVTSTRATLSR